MNYRDDIFAMNVKYMETLQSQSSLESKIKIKVQQSCTVTQGLSNGIRN